MASAVPRLDVSAGWPRCGSCDFRHAPGARCPRPGVWLISGQPVATGRASSRPPILHGRRA